MGPLDVTRTIARIDPAAVLAQAALLVLATPLLVLMVPAALRRVTARHRTRLAAAHP